MWLRRGTTDPHIPAWHRIDDRLTTSGQPGEHQLAEIAALGVRHIINLALHSHEQALADEATSVADLGMEYVNIPVDFVNPTEADYSQFRDALQARKGAVLHIHCIANLRVSAFLYRFRCEETSVCEPEARIDMNRFWRPGQNWALIVGVPEDASRNHHYAGRDYDFTGKV